MNERFSRNEALFGAEGQKRIEETHVALAGCGGLGSHVAQQLAYLGSRTITLIDFDHVTESSLNRLIGAVESDIAEETPKVIVAKRLIEAVNPKAQVVALEVPLEAPEAIEALTSVDVMFGCVDRDLARLKLTELTARLALPYVDLASDTGGEGEEAWYGGHVVFSNGDGCLSCLGLLDQDEINRDSMSPGEREVHARIYGVDRGALAGTGPMVVSVNGAVASLAVTEFMAFVTGMRPPARYVVYRGERSTVGRSNDEPASDCYFCRGLRGTGL